MSDGLISLLPGARVVELSHDLAMDMPVHPSHPPFVFAPFYRHGDLQLPEGYWGTNELILMSGHSGTHIDGFGHVSRSGRMHDDVDARAAQQGPVGLSRHGAETIPPIIRRGTLIDVARSHGVDSLAPGERITTEVLRTAADGVRLESGDCVLIRTGQARHWRNPEMYLGENLGCPGIDAGAAEWLAERGAFLVGSDTAAVEWQSADPDRVGHYPVHLSMLVDHGVYLIENLDLEALSGIGATDFLFLCLPLRLRGSSGSPIRAVALVEAAAAAR